MITKYDRAQPQDYDEVIDLANYVFSHDHEPHDFPAALPKLYKREYFMDGIHYLAREDGRIKAAAGAYPLTLELPAGTKLEGRGIGMVSVHPYSRSRGYMKALMNMALDDMKKDGIVFSCLFGQRQRYGYFGYALAGASQVFTVSRASLRHTGADKGGLEMKPVERGDTDALDAIAALHEAKNIRFARPRERLFDILSSWKAEVYAFYEQGAAVGYLLYSKGYGGEGRVTEINMRDKRLPAASAGAAIGGLLRRLQRDQVEVIAPCHETDKLAALAAIAEGWRLEPAYQFAVFRHRPFIEPFLRLKAALQTLVDGSFTLGIEGAPSLRFTVSGGEPSLAETGEPASFSLSPVEAVEFLFSPAAAHVYPAIRETPFLQSLLPLPLFFESADGV